MEKIWVVVWQIVAESSLRACGQRNQPQGLSGQHGGAFKPKLIGPNVREEKAGGWHC